eukprot:Skav215090  [mRNA]  locus=scaffold1068:72764:75880:+ [translate_table: standard]
MEPVSILLATGAVAIYAAHRVEKMSEKARRGPITLPELMDAKQVEDAAPVQILAVHIQSGLFHRKLSRGGNLKVRVKYGAPGVSIRCDTAQASWGPVAACPEAKLSHQAPPAAARFVPRLDRPEQEQPAAETDGWCWMDGWMAGWNWTGLLGRTVAKGELQVMNKGELRRFLQLLGAKQRQQGFQLDILPVVEGDVEEDVEEDVHVVRGGAWWGMVGHGEAWCHACGDALKHMPLECDWVGSPGCTIDFTAVAWVQYD